MARHELLALLLALASASCGPERDVTQLGEAAISSLGGSATPATTEDVEELERSWQAIYEAPAVAAYAGDFNADGHPDLFLGGAAAEEADGVDKALSAELPGFILAGTPSGDFELRRAAPGFDHTAAAKGATFTGAAFAEAFPRQLARGLGRITRCTAIAGLVALAVSQPSVRALGAILALIGAVGIDANQERFGKCMASEQTTFGCIAIELLDALGQLGVPYFARGEHCYQVPKPAPPLECGDESSMLELCGTDHPSGCCNREFIYGTVFRADARNQAPFPMVPTPTAIPEEPTRVVLDGSVFRNPLGVGIDIDARWLLECLPGDGWALTKNPIALSSEPLSSPQLCAKNVALDGHMLEGIVTQCIIETEAAVHTRIIGKGTSGQRLARLNEHLGYELFVAASRDFKTRVSSALDVIEREGLCCSGSELRGGRLVFGVNDVRVERPPGESGPVTCEPACPQFEACGGDIVGTWRIERECPPQQDGYWDHIPDCQGNFPAAVPTTTGTVAFGADGVARIDLVVSIKYPDATFTPACLARLHRTPADCAILPAEPFYGLQSATCSLKPDGNCGCIMPDVFIPGTRAEPYIRQGDRVITTQMDADDDEPEIIETAFCVRDGELKLQDDDSTVTVLSRVR